MAIQNVNWQADNEYFDATFELSVDLEVYYENNVTDAYGTWRGFVFAIEKSGKHV